MKSCPNCDSEMPKQHDICWNCNYDLINHQVIEFNEPQEIKDIVKETEIKKINCLRCKTPMRFKSLRDLNNARGFIEVLADYVSGKNEPIEVYYCPNCKKVELFIPD